jgi:hypothetical protein
MDGREYREKLKEAIERKAQCAVKYLHTQPLRLVEDGQVTWKGKVEVFQLDGHPEAKIAFGWGIPVDANKTEFITVIGVPPLETPIVAVKAYLASKNRG